jgi:hypothetical protein
MESLNSQIAHDLVMIKKHGFVVLVSAIDHCRHLV